MNALTFTRDYDVYKDSSLILTITVNNAMIANIGLYRDGSLFEQIQKRIGITTFNLGKGKEWEGRILTIIVVASDINPNSDRMEIDFSISGGKEAAPDSLGKIPTKDGEIISFAGTYKLS